MPYHAGAVARTLRRKFLPALRARPSPSSVPSRDLPAPGRPMSARQRLIVRRHPHALRPLSRRAVGASAPTTSPRCRSGDSSRAIPRSTAAALDDVLLGCANQAGEDNRNVARMAALLAGLPESVPGVTVNRLCASGLEAVGQARARDRVGRRRAGDRRAASRACRARRTSWPRPDVAPSSASRSSRTRPWAGASSIRGCATRHGVDSMAQTAENLAREHGIARADQDAYALRSQQRAALALAGGGIARRTDDAAGRGWRVSPLAADEQPRPTRRSRSSPRYSRSWGSARPSPPATLPASTTAHARCCWPPTRRWRAGVSPLERGCSAWLPPAWRRA